MKVNSAFEMAPLTPDLWSIIKAVPQGLVNCFTKSTYWHDYCVAREELILEIMRIVKSNGSDFAYPTRTIHLEKD